MCPPPPTHPPTTPPARPHHHLSHHGPGLAVAARALYPPGSETSSALPRALPKSLQRRMRDPSSKYLCGTHPALLTSVLLWWHQCLQRHQLNPSSCWRARFVVFPDAPRQKGATVLTTLAQLPYFGGATSILFVAKCQSYSNKSYMKSEHMRKLYRQIASPNKHGAWGTPTIQAYSWSMGEKWHIIVNNRLCVV